MSFVVRYRSTGIFKGRFGKGENTMRHVWGLCALPAVAQGLIFRRFAPFTLALLITAGAQAATVHTSGVATAASTPTIAAVQDAASNTPNIAQGSLFSLYGTNLSPSSPGLQNFPRPTVVGGVKVTFAPTAGGAGTDTYLIYVGVSQINALLPSTVPVGYYNVTVTNGTVSSPFFVQVVASKVGLFTQDFSGTGLAVVQNYISQSEVDVNRLTTGAFNGVPISPAKPGQTLIAWGTGLGPYAAGDNTANPVHDFSTSEPIAAVVGGVSIPVAFAGRAGYAGEDQINFTLPGNIPTGCVVSLQISVNGVLSTATYISIAPSSSATACVLPGYTTQQLQHFDQGGTSTSGGFSLTQIAETLAKYGTVKSDNINGSFTLINGFQLGAAAGPTPAAITYGSCQVFNITSANTVSVSQSTYLDAGTVTLTGPPGTNLTNQNIPEDANSYSYQIGTEGVTTTGSILQGTYTLTGAGGKDVGPFHTSISIGPPLTLISPLPTIVTESAGLTVNWQGGNASDVVYVIGASYTNSGTVGNQITATTEFFCTTTAGQQTLTVPASILTQLPIPPPAQIAGTPNGYLEVVSGTTPANFNATLKADGSNIPSVFGSLVGAGSSVVYQ